MEYYIAIKRDKLLIHILDECKMYYAECKKQVSKDYILYDSINMTSKYNVY